MHIAGSGTGAVCLASKIYDRGMKPKVGAKPELYWTNCYCQHQTYYYHLEDLEPATPEEVVAYKEKVRQERNRRARELYAQHKEELREKAEYEEEERKKRETNLATNPYYYDSHTSWQWLSMYHRVPIDGAVASLCSAYDKSFFYYKGKDTMKVSDAKYEELRALYIKKYGGWEEIDLEHTKYDGRIWW